MEHNRSPSGKWLTWNTTSHWPDTLWRCRTKSVLVAKNVWLVMEYWTELIFLIDQQINKSTISLFRCVYSFIISLNIRNTFHFSRWSPDESCDSPPLPPESKWTKKWSLIHWCNNQIFSLCFNALCKGPDPWCSTSTLRALVQLIYRRTKRFEEAHGSCTDQNNNEYNYHDSL